MKEPLFRVHRKRLKVLESLLQKKDIKNGIEEAHKELENLKASLAEFLNSKKEAYDAISGDMLELSLEIAKK